MNNNYTHYTGAEQQERNKIDIVQDPPALNTALVTNVTPGRICLCQAAAMERTLNGSPTLTTADTTRLTTQVSKKPGRILTKSHCNLDHTNECTCRGCI